MFKRLLLRILAIITSFFAYITSLLGVNVTVTGSGRGCGGSWPLCHGQLLPDSMSVASFIEYSHRIVSGGDGLCILILTVWTWFAYKQDRLIRLLGFLSLFFVVLQGVLGALTVVFEGTFAKNALLSFHFGFSLISFASVILLTIRIFQLQSTKTETSAARPIAKVLQYGAWVLAVYTYIVMYTGALVEHAGAATGCGHEVPGCGTRYLPDLSSLAGIQVLHRYAAFLIWLLTLCFMVMVIRGFREHRDLLWGSCWAFLLVTLQALSGILTVLLGEQLMISLVHATLVSVFFAMLCYLCMQVGWPWKRQQQAVEQEVPIVPAKTQGSVGSL